MKKLILVAVIWTAAIFTWRLLWNVYSADVAYVKSQNYLAKGEIEIAEKLIDKAISENSFEPVYFKGRAKIAIADEQDKAVILADLEKAVSLNPNNLVTLRNCIPLYYFLAVKNISDPAGAENIDEKYLLITRNYFRHLTSRFGHDAGVVATLAKYEKQLGLTEDYNNSVELIRKLRPDLLEWYGSFR